MINPDAVNLYIEANGKTVNRNNTDHYYRLSGDDIKVWSVKNVIEPTLQDLASYEQKVIDAIKTKEDIDKLASLKEAAEKAELMKSINIDTGTTPEAKAYQSEKTKQELPKP